MYFSEKAKVVRSIGNHKRGFNSITFFFDVFFFIHSDLMAIRNSGDKKAQVN